MVELNRDYDTLQGMYTNLLGKKEEASIAANLERRQIGEQFKLIDAARQPERPFSPNRPRYNLGGMGVGIGLGLALVALLEYPKGQPAYRRRSVGSPWASRAGRGPLDAVGRGTPATHEVQVRDARLPQQHRAGLRRGARVHVPSLSITCTNSSSVFANGRSI